MTEALAISFERSVAPARRRRLPPTRPFSIRLSDTERLRLEGEAGSRPLSAYLRERLLDDAARRKGGASKRDRAALSQILGRLGQHGLANSLSDIAAAARIGAIALTPDLEQELRSACHDVRDMRTMLIRALGLKAEARV